MKQKEYSIPFSGLKQGKHEFKYRIENKFFEAFGYNEFNATDIDLNVVLNKMGTMMELEMKARGPVNIDCDLTNEPYDQPIKTGLELVIKFGEKYNDEDDEILILTHGEHQVNISQYIYEMVILAVPAKRIHPKVLDGTMQSETLKKLEELQPKEIKNKENTDPRWDVLKSLLTDK